VNVKKSCRSSNVVEIVVLSYDENKNYTVPSDTLIKNAKTYLSKYCLLTDNVYLRPANIVNFTIDYDIICNENANRNSTLALCTNMLIEYFNKDNTQINSPIIKSDVIRMLQSVTGVYSVPSVTFTFTNNSVIEQNGIYLCPNEDSIFEIENSQTDIRGIAR
jgi:phage-related baseplate assembly protein